MRNWISELAYETVPEFQFQSSMYNVHEYFPQSVAMSFYVHTSKGLSGWQTTALDNFFHFWTVQPYEWIDGLQLSHKLDF